MPIDELKRRFPGQLSDSEVEDSGSDMGDDTYTIGAFASCEHTIVDSNIGPTG